MEEPMKISDAIKRLTELKDKHGDIKIGTWSDGICKYIRSIKYIEATDYTGKVVDSCAYLQWWDENEEEESE
jgi:hypothetical protein